MVTAVLALLLVLIRLRPFRDSLALAIVDVPTPIMCAIWLLDSLRGTTWPVMAYRSIQTLNSDADISIAMLSTMFGTDTVVLKSRGFTTFSSSRC